MKRSRGILRRAAEGWARLQARGGKWDLPETCEIAKKEWKGNANPISGFIQAHVEVTKNHRDVVLAEELFDAFMLFAVEENVGTKTGRQTVYNAIEALPGVMKGRSKGVRKFYGLKLNFDDPRAEKLPASRESSLID